MSKRKNLILGGVVILIILVVTIFWMREEKLQVMTVYYPNGKVQVSYNVDSKGKRQEAEIQYLPDEKVLAEIIYRDNIMIKSTQYYRSGRIKYRDYENAQHELISESFEDTEAGQLLPKILK